MRGLIIVPAYNEARSVPAVIAALRREVPSWDICVVDDGSTDGTAAVAGREAADVVLREPVNLGIGGAVQTGYLWARDHGYDLAVQIDGDGQHDPAFIASAAVPIREGRADVVVGSRFLGQGAFRSTGLRRAGIPVLPVRLSGARGDRPGDA